MSMRRCLPVSLPVVIESRNIYWVDVTDNFHNTGNIPGREIEAYAV